MCNILTSKPNLDKAREFKTYTENLDSALHRFMLDSIARPPLDEIADSPSFKVAVSVAPVHDIEHITLYEIMCRQ